MGNSCMANVVTPDPEHTPVSRADSHMASLCFLTTAIIESLKSDPIFVIIGGLFREP